jgi:hypothetical protein
MPGRLIRHLRSHALAYAALFLATSGGAYAAVKLPANSVGSKQLKNGAVTPAKLAPSALAKLKGGIGAAGPQGPLGPQGAKGDSGAAGAKGDTGAAGANGSNGAPGSDGSDGLDGLNGSNGTTGPSGTTGLNGATGPTGATGPRGAAIAARPSGSTPTQSGQGQTNKVSYALTDDTWTQASDEFDVAYAQINVTTPSGCATGLPGAPPQPGFGYEIRDAQTDTTLGSGYQAWFIQVTGFPVTLQSVLVWDTGSAQARDLDFKFWDDCNGGTERYTVNSFKARVVSAR